ncbi:MAG: type II toxin-antitoxin system HicB family antitoxin [Oscillospiraceae bacterium]|nr:type II toxin-antitoxin system HicB family antitoxin [Oscillospiraceae bacterium]
MEKGLDYYMGLSYKIEVVEDKEEGGFALCCPELPGCVTCAETISQGFDMIEDAKKCWFEACLEDRIPIPEPNHLNDFSGQFKLRIPKSLHKTLSERSRQEGISMNQYCLYLLSSGTSSNNTSRETSRF